MSRFGRDNIAGNVGGIVLSTFLLPGRIIQWALYMFPSGGYASVRSQTRLARSPFMTFAYSGLGWAALLYFIFSNT